jgi:hypothetical protein
MPSLAVRTLRFRLRGSSDRGCGRVPIGCLNPRGFAGKAGESRPRLRPREPARLQEISAESRYHAPCLPCRRSRVRIPSAASQKACIRRSFLLRQSPGSSASGRTEAGLAVRRSPAGSKENARLQADSRSSELKSFCRPAGGRAFCLLRPLAGCSCKGHVLAHGRLLARCQRSRSSGGESDLSPDTVRSTLACTATPASRSSHRRKLIAGRRPTQRRGTGHGRLGSWQPLGVFHGRGRRLRRKRASARNRAGLLLIVRCKSKRRIVETLAFMRRALSRSLVGECADCRLY